MNTEKVTKLIEEIAENARQNMRYSNKPTQKSLRKLEELGIAELMTRQHINYAACVNAVIEAAEDAGSRVQGGGFTVDGDGETHEWNNSPSELYLAFNEEDEQPENADAPDYGQILRDMDNAALFSADIDSGTIEQYAQFMIDVDLADPEGKEKARVARREFAESIRRGFACRANYFVRAEGAPIGVTVITEPPVLASLTRIHNRRQTTIKLYQIW